MTTANQELSKQPFLRDQNTLYKNNQKKELP